MKLVTFNLLALSGLMFLCVGCAATQPQQHSVAVTTTSPTQATAKHEYPMSWFVRGWLNPDYGGYYAHPESDDSATSWAWYYMGLVLEPVGYCFTGSR